LGDIFQKNMRPIWSHCWAQKWRQTASKVRQKLLIQLPLSSRTNGLGSTKLMYTRRKHNCYNSCQTLRHKKYVRSFKKSILPSKLNFVESARGRMFSIEPVLGHPFFLQILGICLMPFFIEPS
jgi:hypothetical protein